MKTTLEELQRLEACKEGVSWFKKQKNKDTKAILLKLIKENHFSWANWYVTRLFTHSQAVQYSVYSAELVIKEFEKVFPEDKRPRQAIEAAKTWLKAPTEENRSAAWSAKPTTGSRIIKEAIKILGL